MNIEGKRGIIYNINNNRPKNMWIDGMRARD